MFRGGLSRITPTCRPVGLFLVDLHPSNSIRYSFADSEICTNLSEHVAVKKALAIRLFPQSVDPLQHGCDHVDRSPVALRFT
jgi:hypothetical protein